MKLTVICIAFLLLFAATPELTAQNSTRLDSLSVSIQNNYFSKNSESVFPRLFVSGQDIIQLKKLLAEKDSFVVSAFGQLKTEADKVLDEPLLYYGLDDAKLRIPSIHKFATQIPPLMISYWLTGQAKYAERIWEQAELMAKYPDWGQNRHFLDTGIACFDFAWIYDGLFHFLSEEQKHVVKEALLKNAIIPGRDQMFKNQWWHTIQNNWNGICNSGLVMASLVMFEDNPDLYSAIIAKAVEQIPSYLHTFDPDGQCVEGLLYWSYGLSYTFLGLESMQRCLGTNFGISQIDGFRKTGYFPIWSTGPVAALNVGDDAINYTLPSTFFWFARLLNDVSLAKYQYDLSFKKKNFSWLDLLYYPKELLKESITKFNIPPDNHIRVSELLSFRENMESPRAMFVAMFGGDNGASHGHLDAGSFYIQGLGEYWAFGNLGRDDYTFPGYFSKDTKPGYFDPNESQKEPGRWHFYRLRAEGKNCVVMNPDTRPDQNPTGIAKTIKFESKPGGGFGIIDLTDCYKRDALKYKRGIMLNDNRKRITIQDEIETSHPSEIYWLMNTKADIRIDKDGKTATLQQNGKQLMARIISPVKAEFCVLDDGYLPGQNFPLTKNSPNPGFRKLAIEFKNFEKGTITVEFLQFEGNSTKTFYKQGKLNKLDDWTMNEER